MEEPFEAPGVRGVLHSPECRQWPRVAADAWGRFQLPGSVVGAARARPSQKPDILVVALRLPSASSGRRDRHSAGGPRQGRRCARRGSGPADGARAGLRRWPFLWRTPVGPMLAAGHTGLRGCAALALVSAASAEAAGEKADGVFSGLANSSAIRARNPGSLCIVGRVARCHGSHSGAYGSACRSKGAATTWRRRADMANEMMARLGAVVTAPFGHGLEAPLTEP